jgi:hypothetical protein
MRQDHKPAVAFGAQGELRDIRTTCHHHIPITSGLWHTIAVDLLDHKSIGGLGDRITCRKLGLGVGLGDLTQRWFDSSQTICKPYTFTGELPCAVPPGEDRPLPDRARGDSVSRIFS